MTSEPAPSGPSTGPSMVYDAFLSYAHRDQAAAVGIQKCLHRIGRRMGHLRALRVFRDDTDLAASPDLWGRISDAMDQARYLVVVLSPRAAASQWVDREIGHWLAHRGPANLLFVLCEGVLLWDPQTQRFDPEVCDAAPPALTRPQSLPTEPFFIDVSADAPWDHRSAAFRDRVTALAAPIHGRPKDQLAGDDLREQRRFRRLRAAAIAALVVLTVASVLAATTAVVQRGEAIRQRDAAVAQRLATEARAILAGDFPGNDIKALQILLAAQAIDPRYGADILDAQAERFSTTKIFDTGAQVFLSALSPDGTTIATSSPSGGTVTLWDADTGQRVGEPVPGANGVAFSPDGRLLATGGRSGTVHLYDLGTRKPLRTLSGAPGNVGRVMFSPDGHSVAAATSAGTVQLWDTQTGRGTTRFAHASGAEVLGLAFNPGGDVLATAGKDRLVQLWDVRTGALLRTLTGHTSVVNDVAFNSDGTLLASGGSDSRIRIWNAATGAPARAPIGVFEAVVGVAWDPTGSRVVSANSSGTVRAFTFGASTEAFNMVETPLGGHSGTVLSVSFSRSGDRMVAAGRSGVVWVWNPRDGWPMMSQGNAVTDARFSPDGTVIVSSSEDKTLQLWDTQTARPAGPRWWPGGPDGAWLADAAFSADGREVISGDVAGTVALSDADGHRFVRDMPGKLTQINTLAVSRTGRIAAVGLADDRILIWDDTAAPARAVPIGEGGAKYAAFSDDGRVLLLADEARTVALLDADHGSRVREMEAAVSVSAVTISADGHRFVVGNIDGTMQRWNADTGEPEGSRMTGHSNAVTGLSYSPDGRVIASSSFDQTVRLWDAATGEPIGNPKVAHPGAALGVVFSPDGRLLLSSGSSGELRLWPTSATAADLCAKLTVNISHAQWQDWVGPDIPYRTVCDGLPIPPD